jgi:hypothetical protein
LLCFHYSLRAKREKAAAAAAAMAAATGGALEPAMADPHQQHHGSRSPARSVDHGSPDSQTSKASMRSFITIGDAGGGGGGGGAAPSPSPWGPGGRDSRKDTSRSTSEIHTEPMMIALDSQSVFDGSQTSVLTTTSHGTAPGDRPVVGSATDGKSVASARDDHTSSIKDDQKKDQSKLNAGGGGETKEASLMKSIYYPSISHEVGSSTSLVNHHSIDWV